MKVSELIAILQAIEETQPGLAVEAYGVNSQITLEVEPEDILLMTYTTPNYVVIAT